MVASSTGERVTTHQVKAIASQAEQVVRNLARTHDLSVASARLTDLASEIPDGLQQLAPVWQSDLASAITQTPGGRRILEQQLVADLDHDVAAGVAAGEFRLTGPGAAAILRSAGVAQASVDSVTIVNRTGFTITVTATLTATRRSLPARSIANGTSSLFDFASRTDSPISISVRQPGSNQPPPFDKILNRPYSGRQFTVSVFSGFFSVSV